MYSKIPNTAKLHTCFHLKAVEIIISIEDSFFYKNVRQIMKVVINKQAKNQF